MKSPNEYGFDDASRGADMIRREVEARGLKPDAIQDAVILGSGLGGFAEEHLEGESDAKNSLLSIPYNDIYQELGRPTASGSVAGHNKEVIIAPLKGTDEDRLVMALSGREHPYEGVSGRRATYFMRVMQLLGVKTLFGSGAAGIITPKTLVPPSLMLIHSSEDRAVTRDNPLVGPNDERFGPRFPHMIGVYPEESRKIVKETAEKLADIKLAEGSYIRFQGPHYESPEEIFDAREMMENIWRRGKLMPGEDRFQGEPVSVVAMSHAYEARVAQHATQSKTHPAFQDGRAYVVATTNYAASMGPDGFVEPSSHEEVQENAAILQEQFGRLTRESILKMRK